MYYTIRFVLVSLGLMLIVSCSTQTVSVDYDRNQNFSALKDFRFEIENSVNELDTERIQAAISHELADKGMYFNEDSTVKMTIKAEEFISSEGNSQIGFGAGGGSYHFGTSVSASIPIHSKKVNQIFLISLHNSDNQLVWQGKLEIKSPENRSPENREADIRKGINKLFKNYPPK